jgi:branched-chain amino acid transport system substrate-binding protein
MTMRRKCAAAIAPLLATAALLAGCGSSSVSPAGGGSTGASRSPVLIGASLSLSGDFAADGQAFERGYELWAADINRNGGLLGHRVKLDIVSDDSNAAQVVSNYNKLIQSDHVQLVVGPFSTLLTLPSARVAARYGYAFVEGGGSGPAVFGTGLHNVFAVTPPLTNNLATFARWLASMPATSRPKSAAYATANDPFTQPQIPVAKRILEAAGVKTVYDNVFPSEVTDFTPIATQVADQHPDIFVLGSVDVPSVSAFVQAFIQQHYNPKAFIAAAGPDQGAAFVTAVGRGNEDGILVPNPWYPGFQKADSKQMVEEYIAKYGGTPSSVSNDVAQAYAVGQVLAQAVQATGGFDNQKIISYLHSGVTLNSVQGPVKFDSLGENAGQQALTFQWQTGVLNAVLPAGTPGSKPPLYPKPAWGN